MQASMSRGTVIRIWKTLLHGRYLDARTQSLQIQAITYNEQAAMWGTVDVRMIPVGGRFSATADFTETPAVSYFPLATHGHRMILDVLFVVLMLAHAGVLVCSSARKVWRSIYKPDEVVRSCLILLLRLALFCFALLCVAFHKTCINAVCVGG